MAAAIRLIAAMMLYGLVGRWKVTWSLMVLSGFSRRHSGYGFSTRAVSAMGLPVPNDVVIVISDLTPIAAMIEYGAGAVSPAAAVLGNLAGSGKKLGAEAH